MDNLMLKAIDQAEKAGEIGEIPVGAIIILDNKIIASAGNEVMTKNDPTAHAEMVVIRKACDFLNDRFLTNCDIFVTLEPCAMCASAISFAKIKRIIFGAYDHKGGGVYHGARVISYSFYKPEIISGVCETQCSNILKNFFKNKRI